jgi:HTH-type transcriptional regulator/antitoxin HigA
MMDIRPIRTEADYDWALTEIETYFEHQPPLGTPEADRFDVLTALIQAYESHHYAIEAAETPGASRPTC